MGRNVEDDGLTDEAERSDRVADASPPCPAGSEPPVIPWERRAELGVFTAFWETVFLVCRRPASFGQYLQAEVCPRSARRFRRRVVLSAVVALFFSVVIDLAATWEFPGLGEIIVDPRLDPAVGGAALAFVLVLMLLICSVGSLRPGPRKRWLI